MKPEVHLYRCEDLSLALRNEAKYIKGIRELVNRFNVPVGRDLLASVVQYVGDSKFPLKGKEEFSWGLSRLQDDLDVNGKGLSNSRVMIEMPSKIHPDHTFQLGYFEGWDGKELVLPNLTFIFNKLQSEFEPCMYPDWTEALGNANRALEVWKNYYASKFGRLVILAFPLDDLPLLDFEEDSECIKWLSSEEDKWKKQLEANIKWLTSQGMLASRATAQVLTPGAPHYTDGYCGDNYKLFDSFRTHAMFRGKSKTGKDCIHLICDHSGWQWRVAAIEVVRETIQWVLDKDPKKYYLRWENR